MGKSNLNSEIGNRSGIGSVSGAGVNLDRSTFSGGFGGTFSNLNELANMNTSGAFKKNFQLEPLKFSE